MSGDQRDINPYASPASAATAAHEPITREEALRRLRNPAIGLATASLGSLLWGSAALFWDFGPLPDDIEEHPWLLVPTLGIFVLLPIVVLVSAIKVARGKTRSWLWVAIVSGLVPLGTGFVCFNLAFAFWLLHLAMQRPIRDALRNTNSTG